MKFQHDKKGIDFPWRWTMCCAFTAYVITLSISRSLSRLLPSSGGKGSNEPEGIEFGSILATIKAREEDNAEPESERCQRNGAEERRQQHWFYNHAAHETVKLLVFQDSRRDSASLCDCSLQWLNLKCQAAAELEKNSLCWHWDSVCRGVKWTCRPRTQIQSQHRTCNRQRGVRKHEQKENSSLLVLLAVLLKEKFLLSARKKRKNGRKMFRCRVKIFYIIV